MFYYSKNSPRAPEKKKIRKDNFPGPLDSLQATNVTF